MHKAGVPFRFPIKLFCVSAMLIAVLAVVVGCTSSTPDPVATAAPTEAAEPTPTQASASTVAPTETPGPTATPRPSPTPVPTATPILTSTPVPTPTAMPAPTPTPIPNYPPVITNPGNKSYYQGESITAFDIMVTDAEDTPTVTVSNLPPGLSYGSGQVSGTIDSDATAEDYTVTVSADDGVNPVESAMFLFSVMPNTPPVITNPGNKSYERGETITGFNIIVTDAEDTLTVTLFGLPPGLSYESGEVGGTVAVDAATKDYDVTITAYDNVNAAVSATFTIIVINTAPVITNPGNKSYERGETITGFNITVTDAEDTPTVTLSGLPSGLSYESGQVSGTVTSTAQDYVVTISTADGVNPVVSATFTITVTPRTWPVDDSDGDWSVSTGTDSLTKMEQVSALLQPRGSTGFFDGVLVVRCGYDERVGDNPEVIVGFGNKLAEESGSLEVKYRFDDDPVEIESWSLSTDYEALFAPVPFEFIWQTMHAKELVIREDKGLHGIQTSIFDVEGLAKALYPHRDTCNWIEPWHN